MPLVLTAFITLSDDEKLVLWTLGSVGHPITREHLGKLLPRTPGLDTTILFLRRFGLVRHRVPLDLTSEGMRKAAKLVNTQEANLRRELRQLDAREALAETAPA